MKQLMLRILSLFVSPVTLYLIIWGGSTLLFSFRLVPFPTLKSQTWTAILLSNVAFILGSIAAWFVMPKRRLIRAETKLPNSEWLNLSRLRLALLILIPARLLYILVRVNTILESTGSPWIRIFIDGRGLRHEYRRVGLNAAGIESFDFSQALLVNSLSVVSALVFILGGAYLALRRKNSILSYVPPFLSLLQSVLLLSRAGMVTDMLMFATGYVYVNLFIHNGNMRSGRRWGRARGFLPVLLIGLVIFLMFSVNNTLVSKSSVWAGYRPNVPPMVMSIYWYVTGPYAAFDHYLSEGISYTFGGHTFRIFAKWLVVSGLVDQKYLSSSIGEFIRFRFSPSALNTYTWLRSFYTDFGLLGVTLLPFALGLMSTIFSRLARYRPTPTNLMVLSLFLNTIFFSIMDFTFKDIEFLGMIGMAWVVQQWLSSRKKYKVVYGKRRLV